MYLWEEGDLHVLLLHHLEGLPRALIFALSAFRSIYTDFREKECHIIFFMFLRLFLPVESVIIEGHAVSIHPLKLSSNSQIPEIRRAAVH